MNKSFLFVLIMSLAVSLHAQSWTKPAQSLTDSLTINSQPAVLLINDTTTYMFYQKQQDTNSPAKIYSRDIQNMGNEQLLLGDTTHQYINPHVTLNHTGLYQANLFYESNESENFNLFARKIFEDGSLSEEYPLTASGIDSGSFYVIDDNENVCWTTNHQVTVGRFISGYDSLIVDTTAVIDTGNCFQPICNCFFVAYLKNENGQSHLYGAKLDSLPFYWSDPFPIDTTGNITDIGFPKEEMCNGGLLFFTKAGDLYSYNYFFDTVTGNNLPPEQDSAIFQPDVFYYSMPITRISEFGDFPYVSYTSNEDGNKDVFIFSIRDWLYTNVSENSLENANPKFFDGWSVPDSPCYIYLLNIWETQTVSHGIFLNMSKTEISICSGIDEKEAATIKLTAAPNPFTESTKLKFYVKNQKPVTLFIRSIRGNTIVRFTIEHPQQGWNNIAWNVPATLSRGMYTVEMIQGKQQTTLKIITK